MFARCLLDRVIDIVIQCLRNNTADGCKQAASCSRQACHGSALYASHRCSSGSQASYSTSFILVSSVIPVDASLISCRLI